MKAARIKSEVRSLLNSSALGSKEGNSREPVLPPAPQAHFSVGGAGTEPPQDPLVRPGPRRSRVWARMAVALEVGPCHPSPSRRDLWTPLPGRGRAPGLGPAPRSGGALIRIPPTSCVPVATAPLPAAFKGEVYLHRHTPAQSRRQLRIHQPFHQRGRPPMGFLAG